LVGLTALGERFMFVVEQQCETHGFQVDLVRWTKRENVMIQKTPHSKKWLFSQISDEQSEHAKITEKLQVILVDESDFMQEKPS
jgi:hypothetical protein